MTRGDDATVPDSAMDTGSEYGEPGDRLPEPPLDADEQATLQSLVEDRREVVITDAPEDSPAAVAAADDDTVLPGASTAGGEPSDAPTFRPPEQ
ncbi:MAG: hypothetical protein K0R87_3237 [Pseudonocardia sp.]|jgi:hypothetical protein|nr:hypothetical protein [Pseudonocardia sp.]